MTDTLSTPVGGADRTLRLFGWFLLGHVLVWTLIPTLTRPNPSLDTVEMVFLGREWRLSYPTHPPLPNWISAAVAEASRDALWAQYLAAQVAVVLAFWAVWQLAREIASPGAALLAACLLECCLFYTVRGYELNNSTLLFPCWAMAILCFYRGLRSRRIRPWLGLGLWLGLGMLTKYTTVLLAATMLGFGLLNAEARKAWRRPAPYAAMFVAALVFLPHAWRVAADGFLSVRYAFSHLRPDEPWFHHLLHPLAFLAYQMAMLAPLALAAAPLTGFRWRLPRRDAAGRFPRAFLATMILGPLAVHLAISAVGNVRLHGSWGSCLWMFAGLWLLVGLEVSPAPAAWRRAWKTWALVVVAVAAGAAISNMAHPYVLGEGSRRHFPGRRLAEEVDAAWAHRYHRPLPIVAGDYYLAGNVSFFDPDHPRVYQSTFELITDVAVHDCPWLGDDEFRRQGGVILWSVDLQPEGLPAEVVRRFRIVEKFELPPLPYQTGADVPPARVGVAIVPPED